MRLDAVSAHLLGLPRRIELELAPELLDELLRRSKASGRSIDELALELIDRALQHDSGTTTHHPD
jgi:hypothetical protein